MVRRAEDTDLKRALSAERRKRSVAGTGPRVVDIRHSAYVDSLGDEALEVLVILSDDTKSAQLDWDNLGPIRQAIHEAIRCAKDERYPYVHFLTRQEFRDTRD